MIEGLGIPIGTLGIGSGWAIVALGVIFLMRGNIVPRRTYEDVMHDRDEWRTAHRISEAARLEGLEHQRTTAETASTMNQLMHELQERLRQSKLRQLEDGDTP